jgi:hypothetical protein
MLERMRPTLKGRSNAYQEGYDSMHDIKKRADEHNIAIVLIHHTSEQPTRARFASVSGTNDLIRSADDLAGK